jgi:hypothetical protein
MKVAKIILEDRAGVQKDYTGWVYTVQWDGAVWYIAVSHSNIQTTVMPTSYTHKQAANRAALELAERSGGKWYSLTKGGIFTDKEWERT